MQPQDNDFPLDQVQGGTTPPQDAGQAQQNNGVSQKCWLVLARVGKVILEQADSKRG